MRRALLVGLALVLAGCSSDPDSQGASASAYRLAADRALALIGRGPQPQPFAVTRASLKDYNQPLIVVTLETGVQAGLVPVGANRGHRSWVTLDGAGFTFRGGVVSATRGLGEDLLSADVAATSALIAARKEGSADRVHRRLDGANIVQKMPYSCDVRNNGREAVEVFEITHDTVRMSEVCTLLTSSNRTESFENTYWVGRDGTVWASRQWISDGLGSVFLQQLIK